jgi:hypothetical protein
MKVKFVQSGGFAGTVKGCQLDTAALAPDAAQELQRLIQASGICASGTLLSEKGRDLQHYEMIIDDGIRKTELVFDDSTVPQAAKALLGFLKKHARPTTLD